MFLNYRNDVNPLLTNEKITGFEAGYGFRGNTFAANVNVYHTTWADRVISGSLSSSEDGFYQYQGVKQVHQGVEVDFTFRPTSQLMFKGFTSIGKWEYGQDATYKTFDQDQNLLEEGTIYLDGVKVGDAAQTTFGLGGRYEFVRGLSLDADWYSYDNLYASFQPSDSEFKTADNRGSVKLPSYSLLDAGLTYDWRINDNYKLVMRLNINNVLDEEYISESLTNKHVETGDATYKGVSVKNQAYFGYGRTWNFSMRLKF